MIDERSNVDRERIGSLGGLDDAVEVVDERELAATKITTAADRVVEVGQRHIGGGSVNYVFRAVRQGHMPAADQRNARPNDQQIGLVAGGVQFDRAGIVDCPAQREVSAVTDLHRARVPGDRRLIEYKVVRRNRCGVNPKNRYRFAVAQRDHGIAVGVVGDIAGMSAKPRDIVETDQVDLVQCGVEIIDDVMADRLTEDEEVSVAGTRQVIVARHRKDRRPGA